MKQTIRRILIALRLIPKGCIATTTRGHRCTRKAYPYCKVHAPKDAVTKFWDDMEKADWTPVPADEFAEPETGSFVG